MEVAAFTLLCSLASIVLISSAQHPYAFFYWFSGFISASIIFNPGLFFLDIGPLLFIDPGQLSILLAIVIFSRLKTSSKQKGFYLLIAGVCSGLWLSLLLARAMPVVISGGIVLSCVFLTFWCVSRIKGFTNAALLEEAFLILFILALAVGIFPELYSGWQSAFNLQEANTAATEEPIAPMIIFITLTFTILGGLFTRQKYR